MKVNISTKREWIPNWNGNKKENDPITIVHKAPTMSLRTELLPKPHVLFRIDNAGNPQGGESDLEIDNKKIIYGMLINIRNLTVEDENGEAFEIKTAEDLFSKNAPSILYELVDEIGTYFQKILNEKVVAEKN